LSKAAKFLVIGDLHWRGISPRARLDNIQEALTRKMREVFELAKKHQVLAILQPGDVTDSPGISISTLSDFIELMQELPCPFFTVPGNHDLWGANPASLPRTPFGLLDRADYIQDVAYMPYVFKTGNFEVAITGHGYNTETDTDKNQYCNAAGVIPGLTNPNNYCNIHLAHGMLLERSPGYDIRHTTLDEIGNLINPPQVLICGHDHSGFGFQQVGETLCINPGAICRLTAGEVERPVQVALLQVNEDGIGVELINLQSARPGHEVLSREHLDAEAQREERMNEFLNLLADEGESKFLETREIIDGIARKEKLPKPVVKEALERLAKAQEDLSKMAQ